MCGFAGYFNKRATSGKDIIKSMTLTLEHKAQMILVSG